MQKLEVIQTYTKRWNIKFFPLTVIKITVFVQNKKIPAAFKLNQFFFVEQKYVLYENTLTKLNNFPSMQ